MTLLESLKTKTKDKRYRALPQAWNKPRGCHYPRSFYSHSSCSCFFKSLITRRRARLSRSKISNCACNTRNSSHDWLVMLYASDTVDGVCRAQVGRFVPPSLRE